MAEPCPVAPGGALFVDGVSGADGPCCCGASSRPCRTLTHTTSMIEAVRAENVTINAYNRDGSLLWLAAENWPINLSLGEHLEAPGIDFLALDGGAQIGFCARAFDSEDAAEVELSGADSPDGGVIEIGIIPEDFHQTSDVSFAATVVAASASLVALETCLAPEGGPTISLRLSNAWLNGDVWNAGLTQAVFLAPGSDLTLGPQPVWIGNRGAAGPKGGVGILCVGEPGNPSSIHDIGQNTLHIDSQQVDLWVYSYCSVSLPHGPTFGKPPDGGVGTCPSPLSDGSGVNVSDHAFVELGSAEEPATIQCQQYNGIEMTADSASFVLFEGLIRNMICFGAQVHGGLLDVVGSQFVDDDVGVWLAPGGAVDLSGVDTDYRETPRYPTDVACTNALEMETSDDLVQCQDDNGGFGAIGPTGAAIINTSGTTLNAENVRWLSWDPDAGMPQVWSCPDPVHFDSSTCRCHGADCPLADVGYPLHMQAMYIEGNSTPFDFVDGGLSTRTCESCILEDGGAVVCTEQ